MKGISKSGFTFGVYYIIAKLKPFLRSLVSDKADKVVGGTAGNIATLGTDGNPIDSGYKPSDFASQVDISKCVKNGDGGFTLHDELGNVTLTAHELRMLKSLLVVAE